MDMHAPWVAAVEHRLPDARGVRRVARLHAIAVEDSGPALAAACGYRPEPGELRPDRRWETVTPSGRCARCEQLLGPVDGSVAEPEPGTVADGAQRLPGKTSGSRRPTRVRR